MTRKLRRVPKDKKTGVPKKYLSGSKNRSAKAAEIKRTAEQRKRRKPLSAAVKKALKEKADGTRFYYGELAEVYRKGQGAYLSGGSRNVTMQAWSFGRVNSYMRGDKARTVDAAIYNKYQKRR